jgi:hypothetical protein
MDHPIEKMKRVQLGTLELGQVPEGHYRRLEPSEVEKFSRAVDRALAKRKTNPRASRRMSVQSSRRSGRTPPSRALRTDRAPGVRARSNRPQESAAGTMARAQQRSARAKQIWKRATDIKLSAPGSTDHRPGAPREPSARRSAEAGLARAENRSVARR